MAYGKIKADAIVYDNSGSDVEVSTSSITSKANLASPAFTGTPTAPTASVGTNTTQIATTAYVTANSKLVRVSQASNSTRTGLGNASSRATFWNFSFTKDRANSLLRFHVIMPLGGSGDSYPHFGTTFLRLSTGNYQSNGSDIFGYFHNTRATSNNMGAMILGNFYYGTSGTNISAGNITVYGTFGYHPATGSMRPAPIWNPNASDDNRSRQTISTVVIEEIAS